MAKEIFTIGHSTRPIETFLSLLKAHGIEEVIDIRSVPKSRHCPQLNKEALRKALRNRHIGYGHCKGLGGFRHTSPSSVNTGWENASFRGFADYMQTDSFKEALQNLEKAASKKRCALMCAEAVPWRCHRSLIADALTVQKWKVFHIQSKITAKLHKRTSFLRIRKGELIYPSLI